LLSAVGRAISGIEPYYDAGNVCLMRRGSDTIASIHLRELHERLGGTLVRSISVGFTHRRRGGEGVSVRGPTPEFFFAPEEMKGRGRKLAQRYVEAWPGFARVLEGTLRIEQISTGDELKRVYRDLVEGRTDPALAHVVRVAP